MASERQLLQQLAPEVDEDTLHRLVAAFQDLRNGYDTGKVSYPYSLRGALAGSTAHIYDLPIVYCRADQYRPTYTCIPRRCTR